MARRVTFLLLGALLFLTGCRGYVTPPPNPIGSTSATLRGHVETVVGDENPSYFFRYRVKGALPWINTARVNGTQNGYPDVQVPIPGLRPATPYEYQLCGRSRESDAYDTCVGSDTDSNGYGDVNAVSEFTTKLYHAKPGLTSPTTITLPAGSADPWLSDLTRYSDHSTRDFIIDISAGRSVPVVVYGGRNVRIIGGHVNIADTGDYNQPDTDASEHYGVYLKDQRVSAYVEGVKTSGDIVVPFVLNQNFGAEVILQNIANTEMRTQYHLPGIDASSGRARHGDCIQSWAGPKVLKVANFTCATDYFGPQLQPLQYVGSGVPNNDPRIPTLWDFRWMNIKLYDRGLGDTTRYMFWRETYGRTWPISFNQVYSHVNPSRIQCPNADETVVWPKAQNCSSWPPFVAQGTPPDGDFVPASRVGAGYISPGS